MSVICPTITATNPSAYRIELNQVAPFARRLHIDFMDGEFVRPKSISVAEAYWPEEVMVDFHLMFRQPRKYAQVVAGMRPDLVIIHAEAEGDFSTLAAFWHEQQIRVGVALLPETSVESILPALPMIDHILIFSGNLGHQGGSVADLRLLSKVRELREAKRELEIGWDGGINASNIGQLVRAGVDVLNVGGFIQHARDPAAAYATLESAT